MGNECQGLGTLLQRKQPLVIRRMSVPGQREETTRKMVSLLMSVSAVFPRGQKGWASPP